MTNFVQHVSTVEELSKALIAAGFAPFVGARCDALAPLHEKLDLNVGVLTVPRDDSAIGIAAGVSLAGGYPAVLLGDTGPGSCAEVIASVVSPHETPMLLIVPLLADATFAPKMDPRTERLSGHVLGEFGIDSVSLDPATPVDEPIGTIRAIVQDEHRPAALLVPANSLRQPA